jgi:hypothetical protein
MGITLAGIMYRYVGLKLSFIVPFSVSVLGASLIINFGASNPEWMPYFVLIARFGITSTLHMCWMSSTVVFPTLFAGTAMGINNVFARSATFFAP